MAQTETYTINGITYSNREAATSASAKGLHHHHEPHNQRRHTN